MSSAHDRSSADLINKRTWKKNSALRCYGAVEGFSDPGEEAAFKILRDEIRLGRTLDLGVGGGRTTRILLSETQDYVGVDYTPELLEICREKFPGVAFICADARNLSQCPSDSFTFVQFSYNGICSIDGAGRESVFGEALRVLRSGGVFLFSTFVLERRQTWSRPFSTRTLGGPTFAKVGLSIAKFVVGASLGLWRRIRYRKLESFGDESATFLHGAHDYGFLAYCTTLPVLRRQLEERGFSPSIQIIGKSGKLIGASGMGDEEYCHVIARKP